MRATQALSPGMKVNTACKGKAHQVRTDALSCWEEQVFGRR